MQIVEKANGEVVGIECIHLVHNGADLGLLLSNAHERWCQGRKHPTSACSPCSLLVSAIEGH